MQKVFEFVLRGHTLGDAHRYKSTPSHSPSKKNEWPTSLYPINNLPTRKRSRQENYPLQILHLHVNVYVGEKTILPDEDNERRA